MRTTTRMRLLAAGLAAFWTTIALIVAYGVGWLVIGGIVTTALVAAALWGDLEVDSPDGVGETSVLDHRGDVTVLGNDIEQGRP